MQAHTKNYLSFFGFQIAEDCFCEIPTCGKPAVDIHHIKPRSKFGSKNKNQQDHITNLIGLCRVHHEDAHNNTLTKEYLFSIIESR